MAERLSNVNCKYFLSCHLVETLLPKAVSGVLLEQPGHTQAVLGNLFIPFPLTGSLCSFPLPFSLLVLFF